jgi:hypothetical protein
MSICDVLHVVEAIEELLHERLAVRACLCLEFVLYAETDTLAHLARSRLFIKLQWGGKEEAGGER